MHAGTAIHDDIAFVADRIARRIALGEQRGDRVAPAQVATLAYPADFVVLAAAGPEFGEVHLAGEDPLLLGGQAGEERLGLFRVAGEAEALVQPLGQLAFVGPDHLARLLGQRGAALRQVGRIQVALEEGLIVGPAAPAWSTISAPGRLSPGTTAPRLVIAARSSMRMLRPALISRVPGPATLKLP